LRKQLNGTEVTIQQLFDIGLWAILEPLLSFSTAIVIFGKDNVQERC